MDGRRGQIAENNWYYLNGRCSLYVRRCNEQVVGCETTFCGVSFDAGWYTYYAHRFRLWRVWTLSNGAIPRSGYYKGWGYVVLLTFLRSVFHNHDWKHEVVLTVFGYNWMLSGWWPWVTIRITVRCASWHRFDQSLGNMFWHPLRKFSVCSATVRVASPAVSRYTRFKAESDSRLDPRWFTMVLRDA